MLTTQLRFKRTAFLKTSTVVSFLCGLMMVDAWGVVTTTTPVTTPRRLTLQVGSHLFGTVNTVSFDVSANKVSPDNTPIQGVPNSTTGTTATGVLFRVTSEIPTVGFNNTQTITLTADSSVGLGCVSGSGCGTTIIPFSTISWTSDSAGSSVGDITDGVFSGGATQTLLTASSINNGLRIENILVFTYANSTIYPAGQYTGRVTYTATLP